MREMIIAVVIVFSLSQAVYAETIDLVCQNDWNQFDFTINTTKNTVVLDYNREKFKARKVHISKSKFDFEIVKDGATYQYIIDRTTGEMTSIELDIYKIFAPFKCKKVYQKF